MMKETKLKEEEQKTLEIIERELEIKFYILN